MIMELSNKQKVAALLKSYETGDPESINYINLDRFIQHDLSISDSQDMANAVFGKYPNSAVKILGLFQDEDIVFAYVEYKSALPKIGFEVYRFEDGKIIEHWDNIQEQKLYQPQNPVIIDNITAYNKEITAANKKLAGDAIKDILVKGRTEKLESYFKDGSYTSLRSCFTDRSTGMIRKVNKWSSVDAGVKYTTIHKVLGEGNFVLVMSEGKMQGTHAAFYDLFRIEDNKIAEHWDTIEEIPSSENHNNINGKFKKEAWDLGFWLY